MSKSLNGKGLGTPLLAASKFSSEEIKVSEDSLPHSGGSFLHERDVLPKHNLQVRLLPHPKARKEDTFLVSR